MQRTRVRFTLILAVVGAIASVVGAMTASCSSKPAPVESDLGSVKQEIWTPHWSNLGGDALGDPAIASWQAGRLDAFWRGTDNTLKHRWYPHFGGWSFLEPLGGDVQGSVAAISTAANEIDVFYFNTARDLVRHHISAPNWTWATETIPIASSQDRPASGAGAGPTVASWGPGRLDVFWRGVNGTLKHIWRSTYGGAWTGGATAVEDLGEILASDPAAVSWGELNIDVFFRASNGVLRHKWFPSCTGCNTWTSGSSARTGTNEVLSSPGVASWEPGRLDVFWTRTSGTLGHTWRSGASGTHDQNWWLGGVQDLGGSPGSGVDAVSWGPNRIDVVARQGAGKDVIRLQWTTEDQRNPWYNDPPGVPSTVIADHVVTSGSPWEYSAVVAPPGTVGCPGGGYVVSGTNGAELLLQRSPLNVPGPANDVSVQLNSTATNLIENDSMMTRGPNGSLLLARGVVLDNQCDSDLNPGTFDEGTCSQQTCPMTAGERRSAIGVWRSTNCGGTWSTPAAGGTWNPPADLFDPRLSAFGNGTFGGGPCWGGFDREEIYWDYFSGFTFLTAGAEIDDVETGRPDARVGVMFRSQANGGGPYKMRRFKTGYDQPYMMTSLPGMLFFANCDGGNPVLRWIEPTHSEWGTTWSLPFGPAALRKKIITDDAGTPFRCASHSEWGVEGSQSVSRVGTYLDDAEKRWWVVRVAWPDEPGAKVATVRVSASTTPELDLISTQSITATGAPGGQSVGRIAQLSMIEPDPAQTLMDTFAWSGENTTLYYWREEYWSLLPVGGSSVRVNLANIVRARAVRDATGWGPVFDVSGVRTGTGSVVTSPVPGNKPGDFARGGFWVDNSASAAESPLRYLVVWLDTPISNVRARAFAFPRGFGNN